MRRVVSYGGASGVPASQRLKHKLSMTAGMHLLYNDLKNEHEQQGFLAPVVEPQQERIIHRTSWATRNFSSTKSVINGFVNRRSDSFTSVEGSVLEDAVKGEKRSKGGVPGLPVGIKIEDNREPIGRSAGRDSVLHDFRQKDVKGSAASNSKDPPGSSSDGRKGASVTTSSTDSTITPACANPNPAADRGDGAFQITTAACSQSGASCSDTIHHIKEQEQRVLGSEGTYAPEASVSSSDQVQEGCRLETSTLIEVVADRKHLQDLDLVLPVCDLASASSTSSVAPGVEEDRRALHRVTDGADIDGQVQEKDNDGIKVVEKPSIHSGNSRPNVIQGDLSLERNKGEDVAALKIQSCWKGWRQRGQYRVLKEDAATTRRDQELKNQEMCNAAVVLQKYWRGAQNRLVLKHLKIEKIVRDRAATVIQAHIRGDSSRCEFKKVSCAVLTIQNSWRRYRSSKQALAAAAAAAVAASIQLAGERRLNAAITLQAYARGYVVRQELVRMHKAASSIQRQWKAHRVHMRTRAAIKLQAYSRAFSVRRKYALQKKAMVEERAAILIQALVRGHLARCHLSILHMAALIIQLQWRRYSRNCRFEAAVAERIVAHGADSEKETSADHHADSRVQSGCGPVGVENDVEMEFFSVIDLSNGEDPVGFPKKDALEPCPELCSLEKVLDITVVQQIGQCERAARKGYERGVSSRRDDSGLRPLLNGELPAIPTGELVVGKASQNEDWNDVSIDNLDECLDTCLASLRPLPADLSASGIATEQCFPKFVILEETHSAQKTSSSDRSTGYVSVDGTEAVNVAIPAKAQQASTTSHSAPRLQRASSRKGVKQEISKEVSNISSNGHLNSTNLSSRDSLQPAHTSSAKLKNDFQSKIEIHQVAETDYGSKGQGKSRHTENLKRNEERLQQFAQVFLLQRHIAHQQQRAQSAPPFPPPALAGSGSSQELQVGQTMDVCTQSGIPEQECDSVAVRKVHHDANPSQAVSRHAKHNLDRGNVYCSDTSSTLRQPLLSNQSSGASSFKQHRQTPPTDVVVDMVLLLRKIEEVYGTSDVDFAESSSACFPTRSGDIEEGGPVMDRRKKSALGFTKSISMRQIGLPNVNAMLLVIIAMVVYTRTICQGVIFGHRQTHRKI